MFPIITAIEAVVMNSWFTPLKTDSRKRSLMALLGGVAAIGIAKSVSAQTSAVPLGPSVGNVSGGGGGGGSGATRVASIAALQALASSNGTALLTQANLFGTFNWNSANLSTQVTNDPGQGIYVAPPSPAITTATVAGTITPSSLIGGPYSLGGTFNGAPYYGSGSGFIWFFPSGPFWVLSVSLGDATNCFAIASGASLPPSGNYTHNGSVTGTAVLTVSTVGTSGGSGAWVRQYSGAVNAGWFGWVGDGATANDSAMNGFGTWARAQPTTINGLTLFFPPGTYNFNGQNTQSWLFGIKQLTIDGYGATLQNTYNGASNFGNQLPMGGTAASPELHQTPTGLQALIATTAVGQQSVTCLTPSQAANFPVGSSAIVGSLDIQYVGYPPCWDQFDFVTITANNTSTGTVSFSNDYLSYIHRSDFPDGPNTTPCGKARIWPLDATVNGVFSPFAIKHVYKGLTINIATNNLLTYQTFSGARIHLEDVTICGVSPSVIRHFSALRCTFTLQNESDKLVGVQEYIDCDGPGLMNVQTSSSNMFKARGSTFAQLGVGNVKNAIIDDCDIFGFADGGYLYGAARNVNIINSRIASYPIPPSLAYTDFSTARPIDGANVTYANGVFTIANTSGQAFTWNTIPGNYLVLESNTLDVSNFSADRAVGFVTAMADVSGGVAITTMRPCRVGLRSSTRSARSPGEAVARQELTRVYRSRAARARERPPPSLSALAAM
jgi:hypothetical protein